MPVAPADTPLRLIPEDGRHPWARDVNHLVRLLTTVATGGIALRGDLGTRRDLVRPNTQTAGNYTAVVQSKATGGLHAAFVLSGTAVSAAPTLANSAALITDAGLQLGASARLEAERIRVYEAGRVDYTDLTDTDGELVLSGSGSLAGGLRIGPGQAIRIPESSGGDLSTLASANGELILGGTGPLAGGIQITFDARLMNGRAFAIFNAANTAFGQLAADASGNLVVAGSTSNLIVGGGLTAGGAAQQLTATDVALTAPYAPLSGIGLVQGASGAGSIGYAKYRRFGKLVHLMIQLTCTSAGTAGGSIRITGIPAAIAFANTGFGAPLGTFTFWDQGTAFYHGYAYAPSSSTLEGVANAATNAMGINGPAATLASGDVVACNLVYETSAP